MDTHQNKIKALALIKELYKDKNSLSVTLTGSYSEHFDSDKAGDIDIVIVCKKLSKTYFNKCIKKLKNIKKKYFSKKKELIINNTFGPIKFYKKNSIVFHIMIYDLNSHIDHTIKSPFTCYDWERSNIYIGKSLKELSPVFSLQLRDFYEARRSTKEYLNDILKNRISFRKYIFKKNKYALKKKYFIIDEVNKRDFIYHTIKFLLINYIKYEKNLNILIKETEIDKKFYEIVKNKTLLKKFKELRKLKNKKSNNNIKDSKQLAINFINNFDKFISNEMNKNKSIIFSRHKKTYLNDGVFLGQKSNPGIFDKKITNEFKNIKVDYLVSSPAKRCIETARLIYRNKNISIDNKLKEIDYGKAEKLNISDLKKKYPKILSEWAKGLDPKFPKGESTSDVLNRLNKFLKNELKFNKLKLKKNIFIITHNVVLRCLIGTKFNIKMKDWFKININYFDLLEFRQQKNKLRPNINRIKFLNIFKNLYLK